MNFLFHLVWLGLVWAFGFLGIGNFVAIAEQEDGKPQCYARFYFAKSCQYFTFAGDCQPWQLAHCVAFKITRNELRCPTFFCVSFSLL